MTEYKVIEKVVAERFGILVDFVVIHCQNPECDSHWGVSLATRGTQSLTNLDFICRKCAAEKIAKEY